MMKLLEKDTTDCIIQEVSIKSHCYLLTLTFMIKVGILSKQIFRLRL